MPDCYTFLQQAQEGPASIQVRFVAVHLSEGNTEGNLQRQASISVKPAGQEQLEVLAWRGASPCELGTAATGSLTGTSLSSTLSSQALQRLVQSILPKAGARGVAITCEPGTAAIGGRVGTSVSSRFSSHAAANCMGTYTSGPISGTCMSRACGATKSVMVTPLLLRHHIPMSEKTSQQLHQRQLHEHGLVRHEQRDEDSVVVPAAEQDFQSPFTISQPDLMAVSRKQYLDLADLPVVL